MSKKSKLIYRICSDCGSLHVIKIPKGTILDSAIVAEFPYVRGKTGYMNNYVAISPLDIKCQLLECNEKGSMLQIPPSLEKVFNLFMKLGMAPTHLDMIDVPVNEELTHNAPYVAHSVEIKLRPIDKKRAKFFDATFNNYMINSRIDPTIPTSHYSAIWYKDNSFVYQSVVADQWTPTVMMDTITSGDIIYDFALDLKQCKKNYDRLNKKHSPRIEKLLDEPFDSKEMTKRMKELYDVCHKPSEKEKTKLAKNSSPKKTKATKRKKAEADKKAFVTE